jgi:putative cell wall-binding protein
VVLVATGTNFPDALAAAAAAAKLNGPVLLTPPGALPVEVVAEINRLNPDGILVIGGTAAVSDTVLGQLAALKPTTRISGANRYDTAVAISQHAFTNPNAVNRVYIAVGTNFPDALAGAAAAAARGAPVLLTPSDSLPATVILEIVRLGPSRIYILGGTAVISTNVANQLQALLP